MREDPHLQENSKECWNRIGDWGDATCVELETAIHCHNCPVYAAAGRSLLDREAPEGYLSEWTRVLAREDEVGNLDALSVLVFRLQKEWLALSTRLFKELLEERVVCHLPHRSNDVFMGLVNVQGEMRLCISLSDFLGLEKEDHSAQKMSHIVYRRMAVVEREGDCWVFPVDEVHGIHRFHPDELLDVPVTISKAAATYTKGIVRWQDRSIGCLDDELLFNSLQRRIL